MISFEQRCAISPRKIADHDLTEPNISFSKIRIGKVKGDGYDNNNEH